MSRATYIWLAAVTLLLILVAGACGQGRSPTGPERASSARPAGEPGQAAVDRGKIYVVDETGAIREI